MLLLKDIKKDYQTGSEIVNALKGLNISFRKSEFVSILGQSGCGKTTLLNIIGGLDRYTSGDLIINGVSTKDYQDRDWDTYRNHSIGFVFQSYNLIPHLTIIENVALALTIGGLKYSERKERAKEVLIKVGLEDKLTKKPNELSGGQMQRVAIARALVNEPEIILADEPTGALDSETSVQIMNLLKEIAKEKLVIMVTHNPDLAYQYSTRIVKMLDGHIIDDSDPYKEEIVVHNEIIENKEKLNRKKKYSSMDFLTAIKLSALNLLSKKRRTLITSLAAGIGIMGIAIILSVSNGMQDYIDKTMMDSASFNYITISSTTAKLPDFGATGPSSNQPDMEAYPENTTGIYPYEEEKIETRKQRLDNDFISFLEAKTKGMIIDIAYSYDVAMNILTKVDDSYKLVSSSSFKETLSNAEYVSQYYTILAQKEGTNGVPVNATEVTLVVDKYNRLSTSILDALGIKYDKENLSEIKYEELLGKEFRIVFNNGWYTPIELNGKTIYQAANTSTYETAYNSENNGITVTITSVLRAKEDAPTSWLSNGINYSPALTKVILDNNKESDVALAQYESKTVDVTTGKEFSKTGGLGSLVGFATTYESMLEKLGYTQTPVGITIYPTNVENRKEIIKILDSWNSVKEVGDEAAVIEYIDMSSIMTSLLSSVVDVVTYVLMAFSITSLVISSIMIAIIIYASVIERTKEIGVLRSLGARKKDVGRIFEAEAILIGLISGILAMIATLIVNAIINIILDNLLGVSTIANLSLITAISLVLLSAGLLLIASLIPAGIASKKEPAVALRTE